MKMIEEVLSEDRINNYLNTETDTLTEREGVIALREILSLRSRVEELTAKVAYQTGKKQTIFDLCKGTIERKKEKIAELESRATTAEKRNDVFEKCIHRALKMWQEAHPDDESWPDGAVNIAWIMERATTAEGNVKELVEALDFYADACNWQPNGDVTDFGYDPNSTSRTDDDGGEIARSILSSIESGKETKIGGAG